MIFHDFTITKNRNRSLQINIEIKKTKKIKKAEKLGKNEYAQTARQRLSNDNKKPSKNPKKTIRRPRKF